MLLCGKASAELGARLCGGIFEGVRVELLVVPGCPHEAAARAVLAHAAEFAGVGDVAVSATVTDTERQARVRGFAGSPTFLVEGADPVRRAGRAGRA